MTKEDMIQEDKTSSLLAKSNLKCEALVEIISAYQSELESVSLSLSQLTSEKEGRHSVEADCLAYKARAEALEMKLISSSKRAGAIKDDNEHTVTGLLDQISQLKSTGTIFLSS
jgi:hypothetical protein